MGKWQGIKQEDTDKDFLSQKNTPEGLCPAFWVFLVKTFMSYIAMSYTKWQLFKVRNNFAQDISGYLCLFSGKVAFFSDPTVLLNTHNRQYYTF